MARPSSKKPLKETAVSPAAPKTPQPTAQAPKKPPGRPRKSKPTPGKENTIPSSPLGSGASGPPATSSSDDLQLNLANITNIKLLRKRIAELEARRTTAERDTNGTGKGQNQSGPVQALVKKKGQHAITGRDTHGADQDQTLSSPVQAPVKKKAQRAMAEMDTHSADQAKIPSSPLKAPVKKKAKGGTEKGTSGNKPTHQMKKATIPVEDADDEEVVERMEKPPGEAGTSDGFNLQESMGLKDDKDLYNNIMREVRTQVHLNPKLDPFITFNYQDAGSLANVYRKVTAMYPYLTSDRFPRSWPIAEMTKQYLANWRRRVRAAARRAKAAKAAKAALSSKTASSSKRRLEDDEE